MNEQSLINRAEEVVEAFEAGEPVELVDVVQLVADMLENLREIPN